MAVKKKIISIENNSNSTILALRVNCNEFSFIDILQQELGVMLKIQQPRVFELSSGISTIHALYSAHDEQRKITIDLIANKTDKGPLIDFMDSIDFFLRITGLSIGLEPRIQSIQNISSILYAQKIDLQKFNNKQQKIITHIFL